MLKTTLVQTRFVNDFQELRQALQTAKSAADAAESAFKGIEGTSADLRRTASNIDTYEARNDNGEKDCSDSGKAALSTLNGMDRKQDSLEELHRNEESARATTTQELTEAGGLARGLQTDPNDKTQLLNAIENAKQQNGQGAYDYTNVDTTIFTAGLDLPNAIEYANNIAADNDKGKDVSLQGTFLEQRLDKLEGTYGQASSFADRAESYQDRVGNEVDRALTQLSRIEGKRIRRFLDATGIGYIVEPKTCVAQFEPERNPTILGFAEAPRGVVTDLLPRDLRVDAAFGFQFPRP